MRVNISEYEMMLGVRQREGDVIPEALRGVFSGFCVPSQAHLLPWENVYDHIRM